MRALAIAVGLAGMFSVGRGLVLAAPTNAASRSADVLTNAAQIRQLTPVQAAYAPPVRLTGVVMDSMEAGPGRQALILADQTAGIYVRAPDNQTNLLSGFYRQDQLEITGVAGAGQFAPIITARTVRKLGTAPAPAAKPVTYPQLITGSLDAQWVEIQGVVRRVYDVWTNSDVQRIVVAAEGGVVPVRYTTRPGQMMEVDSEVRVRAICFYQFNQRRQVLSPVLEVPRDVPVEIVKPAPARPYDAPVCPATSLLTFSPGNLLSHAHRVHVRGVVTCAQPGSYVWIRDGATGLRIQTLQPTHLFPGYEVDVLGFPTFGVYPCVLEDSVFRKIGSTPSPLPVVLTNFNEAFDQVDNLVAVEGRLTQVQPVLDGMALTLDKDGQTFKAVLKLASSRLARPDWQADSRVRITGICSLVYDDTRPFAGIWRPESFQLLLRSPADLVVLQPPSWWTLKHLTIFLGAASGGLALLTGWVVALSRRRLREQAHQREMAEAEFAAILTERNRLAREIHDTLAQGLTATSVQLRLARKQLDGASESVSRHLNTALVLVRDSLEEARSSIWNMRSHVLETSDLAGALDGILKQMFDGTEVATAFEATGRVRRLAPLIENNVLRVGQEAIVNAAKHAHATNVRLALEFGERQLHLRVTDDGRGFDPSRPVRQASAGGFGLMGMRERAAEMHGELTVRSAPGQGAEINLSIPLAGE